MVILVDTNVIIDFLLTRKPFYKASSEVNLCEFLHVVGANHSEVVKAIQIFRLSEVPAVSPEDFLAVIS